MAYSDFSNKRCTEAFGVFSQVVTSTSLRVGDLVTSSGAMAMSSAAALAADCVAIEDYPSSTQYASSTEMAIKCAMAAVFKVQPSTSTSSIGQYTAGSHGGTVGDQLYLGESTGVPTTNSSGTVMQLVGMIVKSDEIFVQIPQHRAETSLDIDELYVGGDCRVGGAGGGCSSGDLQIGADTNGQIKMTSSGAVTIGGSLTVASTLTMSADSTLSGDIAVSTGCKVVFSENNLTAAGGEVTSKGLITISRSTAATYTTPTPTAGSLLFIMDESNPNNNNHAIQATGNLVFTFNGSNDKATFSKEKQGMAVFALTSTRFAIITSGEVSLGNR